MNKIVSIAGTDLTVRFVNFRKKDRVQHQQDLNNARYEGFMRSDFGTPRISEYTYDRQEIVRVCE